MTIVILMPTMRWQNWPRVRENIEAAREWAKVQLFWMPVMYRDEWEAAPIEARAEIAAMWIYPLIVNAEPGCNAICHKFNAGLNRLDDGPHERNLWVFGGADDDLIPKSFAVRFAAAAAEFGRGGTPPSVIVCSCDRGQRVPPGAYGHGDLIAAPENMKVCKVTGSQALIRLEALNGLRFAHHPWADGILIEQLHNLMPEKFCYIPDFFVPFNALQEGRWDEDKLKTLIEK